MATVRGAVIVTSDSVYLGRKEDLVTPLLEEGLGEKGVRVVFRRVTPNDEASIRSALEEAVREADLVVVTGGTGISPRDVSYEAISSLASKELPGFGEEFRRRSLRTAGYKALLSRASCFVVGGSIVFLVPGSRDAVLTALEIIAGMAGHAVEQLKGHGH